MIVKIDLEAINKQKSFGLTNPKDYKLSYSYDYAMRTLYHVTTVKKAKAYHKSKKIAKPVRGFTTLYAAMAWAIKANRKVIYEIKGDESKCHKLPDHHNKYGEAWWFDCDIPIEQIKCEYSGGN